MKIFWFKINYDRTVSLRPWSQVKNQSVHLKFDGQE